jgi:hypothetical protein
MQDPSLAPRAERPIPVKLPNNTTMYVQATRLGGPSEVAGGLPDFSDVTEKIEGIAQAVKQSIEHVKPRRTTVEFGLEVALESGKLTSLLVKGSGSASLHITLEWGEESPSSSPASHSAAP